MHFVCVHAFAFSVPLRMVFIEGAVTSSEAAQRISAFPLPLPIFSLLLYRIGGFEAAVRVYRLCICIVTS